VIELHLHDSSLMFFGILLRLIDNMTTFHFFLWLS